ncbi:MAG: hypothetical protein IJZ19_04880 [Lentisphaeria bacterium]|nr:hypothetical protein [Lentisphaeria bacterium]
MPGSCFGAILPLNAPRRLKSPAGDDSRPLPGLTFGRRPLNAPIKYAALFYRSIAPGEWYCFMRGNIDAALVLSPPF